MHRYLYILFFVVGIIGFYSVAFAEDCNVTVKCVCESQNHVRVVPCPNDFSNAAIDCTKEGIPEGTCAVDCGQGVAASCEEIGIECKDNETDNCLVTLPVEVFQSEPPTPTCGDGVIDTGEECDGTQLGSLTCQDFDCTGGTLACTASCTRDFSGCTGCAVSCNSDAECTSGQYCDQDEDADGVRECVTKKNNGISCAENNECASDNCVEGFCCNTPCGDACDSCNISGSVGTCTLNLGGSQGNPSCYPYLCNGTSANCPDSCLSHADCVGSNNCSNNVCVP